MTDLFNTLSHTPLPTILVLAGIAFWLLAIAGSVAGKITVEPGKQKTAGVLGTVFLISGLVLFFVPSHDNQSGQDETAKSTGSQTSSKQTRENAGRPSPGVNCTGTGTPDEAEICRSTALSELDRQLYGVYQALLKRLDQGEQTQLAREESVWVKQRGECQSDESCLTAAYKSRIEQLQSAR